MPGRDIIVIGASAGGVEARTSLMRGLPADLPAAVFVVLHLPADAVSVLPRLLDRAGPLRAGPIDDGGQLLNGHIYVATSNQHLLVERGALRLVRGPRERGHRPAVDPLCRSAARAYGRRVIGVILSGSLNHGTAGLLAVKLHGGFSVVQDPAEATYPGMPERGRQRRRGLGQPGDEVMMSEPAEGSASAAPGSREGLVDLGDGDEF